MPANCYVFIHAAADSRVGVVTRGPPGWQITAFDEAGMSDAAARKMVDVLNSFQGVAPAMAERMLAAAVGGWCNSQRLASATDRLSDHARACQ